MEPTISLKMDEKGDESSNFKFFTPYTPLFILNSSQINLLEGKTLE